MEGLDVSLIVVITLVVLVLIFIKMSLVIISQSETKIVERLGKYHATLKPGINIIIPFIDKAKTIISLANGRYVYTNKIDLREQVYDFDKQNVITKDNIQMQINALLYFQIVDPFKAVYEISNLPNAIEKLTQTTLRNIIGELELDQTLTSRDTINNKLRAVLDDATDKWGVKVNRVELQDIMPPASVLQAMEKQMQAERNKRATILTVPRPRSRRLSSPPKVKLKLAFAVPRPRQWQLIRLPRLLVRALILPTTSSPRTTSRPSKLSPAVLLPRQFTFPTRQATSWAA